MADKRTDFQRLVNAARDWRKWASKNGGCPHHFQEPFSYCEECQYDEQVGEEMWDATSFLADHTDDCALLTNPMRGECDCQSAEP